LSFRIDHNDFVVRKRAMRFGVNGTNPFAGIKINAGDAIAPVSSSDGKT
jgi:hypothetical protein